MKKWNMVIDVARCHDCNDCFLADKDEFVGNDFPPYSAAQPWHGHRWMNIERKERGQYPIVQTGLPAHAVPCTATRRPASTADGAVYKREDGLVIIDPVKAKGHKEIVDDLPLRRHLLERGEAAAAEVHRLRPPARRRLDRDPLPPGLPHRGHQAGAGRGRRDAQPWWRGEGLERYQAELGTKPRVYYKNLHRWDKAFVVRQRGLQRHRRVRRGRQGHGVGRRRHGRRRRGEQLRRVRGRQAGAGQEYEVKIEAAGYKAVARTVTLDESLNLGLVMLGEGVSRLVSRPDIGPMFGARRKAGPDAFLTELRLHRPTAARSYASRRRGHKTSVGTATRAAGRATCQRRRHARAVRRAGRVRNGPSSAT